MRLPPCSGASQAAGEATPRQLFTLLEKTLSRKPWNPLAMIPSPEAIRERLAETEELAEKLRVLLGVSEEINRKKESPSKPDLTPPSAALLPSPVMLRARLAIALREVALVRRLISAAESVRPPKPNA